MIKTKIIGMVHGTQQRGHKGYYHMTPITVKKSREKAIQDVKQGIYSRDLIPDTGFDFKKVKGTIIKSTEIKRHETKTKTIIEKNTFWNKIGFVPVKDIPHLCDHIHKFLSKNT
jgi:hypothetical protein